MPEEGYRHEGRMTAFPDPATVPGLTPGSLVRGVTLQPEDTGLRRHVYNRRLLMPMLLPGFAGVLFFRGRDATKFLEQYNKVCEGYELVEEQKAVRLLLYCKRSIRDIIKTFKE